MRFQRITSAPLWEGLVIPGIERGDDRIAIHSAEPMPALAPYVQSIWMMNWNLPAGAELRAIVVPTPCVHLMGFFVPVVAPGPLWHAFVTVKTKGDLITLKGRGQTFGIEFKPGGVYPFLKTSVMGWDKGVLSLKDAFLDPPESPAALFDLPTFAKWTCEFEAFLVRRLPTLRPHNLEVISRAVSLMMTTEVKQMDEIPSLLGVSKRSLQRIFQNEVGISPRDTLRVARFHRAIKAMNDRTPVSLAQFAQESGFFDQPHMINEFKKLVETSPGRFKKYW